MFARIFAPRNFAISALLGFLLLPEPAAAQQGMNLYQWSGHYGSGSGGAEYSSPSPVPAAPYEYTAPYRSVNAPVTVYQPIDQPVGTAERGLALTSTAGQGSAESHAVLLNVSVPAGAEIWFEGTRTVQRGRLRQFISPPLIPGREYSYDVKARWTENGKELTQTRHLVVQAGDVMSVSFNSATPSAAAAR